jgi:hypothetical protein
MKPLKRFVLRLMDAVNESIPLVQHTEALVILLPTHTVRGVIIPELAETGQSLCLWRPSDREPFRFNGVLMVEDEAFKTAIVRSLVTDHRIEVLL